MWYLNNMLVGYILKSEYLEYKKNNDDVAIEII